MTVIPFCFVIECDTLSLLHRSNVCFVFLSLTYFCDFLECAMSSFTSNHWTNCWFISPSYFEPKYLYSHLSLMIIYWEVFSHTLCLPVQICSFSRANSVSPFHFPLFFPLLTPLIVYSFSYNVRSHHIRTFPLSPLISLLYFSLFLSSSLVFKTLTFLYSLLLFSLFSPWTEPSLSMFASLYVLSFDNPLEPLSPI